MLPLLKSDKLVLEQHSFTFAYFCCPRPSLGLLPVLPLLNSEKLVLEQHSFTFADFCCPRPPLGLLPVLVLSSEKLVWEQKPDRCEPQDTLRCSKAVLEVRGEISWLLGAPELELVAQKHGFGHETGRRGSV